MIAELLHLFLVRKTEIRLLLFPTHIVQVLNELRNQSILINYIKTNSKASFLEKIKHIRIKFEKGIPNSDSRNGIRK